jgi:hypothetical protein
MTKINQSLTIEEYKALGKAIKKATKHLKLIRKVILEKDIDFTSDGFVEPLEDVLGKLVCDLSNFAYDLESHMDSEHPEQIIDTIEFFN